MNAIAILGVAWMVAVVLGIWTIAGLLFIANRREPIPDQAVVDQALLRYYRKQLEREGCTFEDQQSHLGAKENV